MFEDRVGREALRQLLREIVLNGQWIEGTKGNRSQYGKNVSSDNVLIGIKCACRPAGGDVLPQPPFQPLPKGTEGTRTNGRGDDAFIEHTQRLFIGAERFGVPPAAAARERHIIKTSLVIIRQIFLQGFACHVEIPPYDYMQRKTVENGLCYE